MMKKLLAIVLVLCMFMPLCAVAEESAFTLRNGYRWSMSIEEIEALAVEEGLTCSGKSDGYIAFDNVPVAGYNAKMAIMIIPDEISIMGYVFFLLDPVRDSDSNKKMYNDFLVGLTKIYGEPADDGSGNEDGNVTWILMPDTEIWLMLFPQTESDVYCGIQYMYYFQPISTPMPTTTPQPTPEQTLVPVPNDGL